MTYTFGDREIFGDNSIETVIAPDVSKHMVRFPYEAEFHEETRKAILSWLRSKDILQADYTMCYVEAWSEKHQRFIPERIFSSAWDADKLADEFRYDKKISARVVYCSYYDFPAKGYDGITRR